LPRMRMWRHHLVGGRRLLFIVGRVPVLLDPHTARCADLQRRCERWFARFILNESPATQFGATEIKALFCDLRESAFLNRRSRANFWLDAAMRRHGCRGRPIWEGRWLVTTGTAKRRLGRRWLAENERKNRKSFPRATHWRAVHQPARRPQRRTASLPPNLTLETCSTTG
jgi:hypothetical protein